MSDVNVPSDFAVLPLGSTLTFKTCICACTQFYSAVLINIFSCFRFAHVAYSIAASTGIAATTDLSNEMSLENMIRTDRNDDQVHQNKIPNLKLVSI